MIGFQIYYCSSNLSNACSSITAATSNRNCVAAGGSVGSGRKLCGNKDQADEKCLICLTENRSATIVHGETGHIACCLTCARILKSRGDKVSKCERKNIIFLWISFFLRIDCFLKSVPCVDCQLRPSSSSSGHDVAHSQFYECVSLYRNKKIIYHYSFKN